MGEIDTYRGSIMSEEGKIESLAVPAEDLAGMLGCSKRHIRSLDRRHIIPRIKLGSLVRYEPDRVIEALRKAPGSREARVTELQITESLIKPRRFKRINWLDR